VRRRMTMATPIAAVVVATMYVLFAR
jgi:hypothetical protein